MGILNKTHRVFLCEVVKRKLTGYLDAYKVQSTASQTALILPASKDRTIRRQNYCYPSLGGPLCKWRHCHCCYHCKLRTHVAEIRMLSGSVTKGTSDNLSTTMRWLTQTGQIIADDTADYSRGLLTSNAMWTHALDIQCWDIRPSKILV